LLDGGQDEVGSEGEEVEGHPDRRSVPQSAACRQPREVLYLSMMRSAAVLVCTLALAACGGASIRRTPAERQLAAAPAVKALQEARFEDAAKEAARVLGDDAGNGQARLVAAVSRYRLTMAQVDLDIRTAVGGAMVAHGFNHDLVRNSLDHAEKEFAKIDDDLAVAAEDPDVSLELCLACWQVDWNRSGEVDESDKRLLQIEVDDKLQELPEGDPRRTPTFRFDRGDVYWGRAMIAFQRAIIDLILAYDWHQLDRLMQDSMPVIKIPLKEKGRVTAAKKLILDALDLSDRSREAYLAETDDDREWLPNPKQQSHPLPLPVDAALYETWSLVVGDLRRLVKGEEGLDVRAIAMLGDHSWKNPPGGYINLGGRATRGCASRPRPRWSARSAPPAPSSGGRSPWARPRCRG